MAHHGPPEIGHFLTHGLLTLDCMAPCMEFIDFLYEALVLQQSNIGKMLLFNFF